MGEEQDDKETQGLEGGYSSDRGHSRQSLDWKSGKLRENLSAQSKGEDEGEEEDSDGENERSPPLFKGAKVRGSNRSSDDIVESPTKTTRKRKSTIPAVDSLAMATRGKRGHKQAIACWCQWIHWMLVLCNQQKQCMWYNNNEKAVDTDSMLIHPIKWI